MLLYMQTRKFHAKMSFFRVLWYFNPMRMLFFYIHLLSVSHISQAFNSPEDNCSHLKSVASVSQVTGVLHHPHGKVMVCQWLIQTGIPHSLVHFVLVNSTFSLPWDRVSFYQSSIFDPPVAILSGTSRLSLQISTDTMGALIVLSIHTDPSQNVSASTVTLRYTVLSPRKCSLNCSIEPHLCTEAMEVMGEDADLFAFCRNDTVFIPPLPVSLRDLPSGVFSELPRNLQSLHLPRPSAFHASVHVLNPQAGIYLFGGLSHQRVTLSDVLWRFPLSIDGKWSQVRVEGPERPPCLYQHTLNYWRASQTLVMFGGLFCNNHTISHHLWMLRLSDGETWQKYSLSRQKDGQRKAFGVFGHQAHILETQEELLVFFGMDQGQRLSPFVQKIRLRDLPASSSVFVSASVNLPRFLGGLPPLGLLHGTSVLDMQNACIWFHGGLTHLNNSTRSDSPWPSNVIASSALLAFHWATGEWRFHSASGQGRMGHSVILLSNSTSHPHGQLVLIGGCLVLSSTSVNCEELLPSVELFSVHSNTWSSLVLGTEAAFQIARFGASLHRVAVPSENEEVLLLIGGFRRRYLRSVSVARLSCDGTSSERECSASSSLLASRCRWDPDSRQCVSGPEAITPGGSIHDCFNGPSGTSCPSCLSKDHCVWCSKERACRPANSPHSEMCARLQSSQLSVNMSLESKAVASCVLFEKSSCALGSLSRISCTACQTRSTCKWNSEQSLCEDAEQSSVIVTSRLCPSSCANASQCDMCVTHKHCVWCSTQSRCYEWSSLLATNQMSQCALIITGLAARCPAVSVKKPLSPLPTSRLPWLLCGSQHTCHDCTMLPQCGWCEDLALPWKGAGKCWPGGVSGPLSDMMREDGGNSTRTVWPPLTNLTSCVKAKWHFSYEQCPSCQCHGFGNCPPTQTTDTDTSVTFPTESMDLCKCVNNTRGAHCEVCAAGYFGNPQVGVACEPCPCLRRKIDSDEEETVAFNCSPTASCQDYCIHAGATGHSCERCAAPTKQLRGQCYYQVHQGYHTRLSTVDNFLLKASHRYLHLLFVPTTPNDAFIEIDCDPPSEAIITYEFIPWQSNRTAVPLPMQPAILAWGPYNTDNMANEYPKCHRFAIHLSRVDYMPLVNSSFLFHIALPNNTDFSHMNISVHFTRDPRDHILLIFILTGCFMMLMFVVLALWRLRFHYLHFRHIELQSWRLTQRALAIVEYVSESSTTTKSEDDGAHIQLLQASSSCQGALPPSRSAVEQSIVGLQLLHTTPPLTQHHRRHRRHWSNESPQAVAMTVLLQMPACDQTSTLSSQTLTFATGLVKVTGSEWGQFQRHATLVTATSTENGSTQGLPQQQRMSRLGALRRAFHATCVQCRN